MEAGTKFCLRMGDELRARMNQQGWAGCGRGVIQQVETRRITVRFLDGQPWQFLRREFEAVCDPDDELMEEVWE
jgi:hypothetical protein